MSTVDVEIIIQPKGRGKPRRDTPAAQAAATPRIPRVARLMALAIKFQGMVERDEVRDYAELARLGYVTRARLTQVMNLLLLAPDIQEHLISLSSAVAIRETQLRCIAGIVDWREQRQRFESLAGSAS
jgi:hypothetical protein